MKKKYYKPTIEDFILGLDYETREVKNEEWVSKKITRDSFMAQNGNLSEIHIIMHDLYTKDAKNEYRVPFVTEDNLLDRGFTKSTPLFIGSELYNTYISKEIRITRKEHEFNIKSKEGDNMFEGVIINVMMLDKILESLDLDSSANHKLRRKISTAEYE